ncbi:MAG: VWA domain-containing protein [Deltaproteobacteria bacterium]|nr:VWA domain-containing protein [Candidatus Zymogenaceae bacterium]
MRVIRFFLLALALLLLPGLVFADGIIIIDPPPHPPKPIIPLEVKYHKVTVDITNQVSTTHIDEVFVNPNDIDLEGTFIFPLPEGASFSDLAMYIDGKKVEGKVLDAGEARRTYEDIVRRLKDPALLEYVNRNTFKLRVYPIPARGEKRIEITYTETLKYDFGTVRYVYPLNTEKFSSAPLKEVSLDVSINSSAPITTVYSPSHEIDIARKGTKDVRLSYEDKNVLPDRDFVLYYNVSDKDVGLSLITYKESRGPGYFMLLISPRQDIDPSDVVPKDVTFVLDTSGSMKGDKLTQAQKALKYCIGALNTRDRFNVIRFSTDTEKFRSGPVSPDRTNRDAAFNFIDMMTARGGTNINDSLTDALGVVTDRKRPHIIVFITDGEPTVGTTDVGAIIKNVAAANRAKTRIFVFGVGEDINTHLLDRISSTNHGVSEYVTPTENIESVVSGFFTKINDPAMTDLVLKSNRIRLKDYYPVTLPDLFAGSQITVVGTYEGSGPCTITLSGTTGSHETVFEYPVTFPDRDSKNDFLPRIWASRKVAYLLDEIRLNGENSELVNEIKDLATTFGIVTPYTSFLVLEDRAQGFVPASPADRDDVDMMSGTGVLKEERGGFALKSSEAMRDMKEKSVVDTPKLMSIKQVGDRTFLLRDKTWIDTAYTEGTRTVDLSFNSNAYWKFISEHPGIGKFLALGNNVIFIYDGAWYRVK